MSDMPDEIFAYTNHNNFWCNDEQKAQFYSPWAKYLRADLAPPQEVLKLCLEALESWKLFLPIRDGDTIYSGHPKVLTEIAIEKLKPFVRG